MILRFREDSFKLRRKMWDFHILNHNLLEDCKALNTLSLKQELKVSQRVGEWKNDELTKGIEAAVPR